MCEYYLPVAKNGLLFYQILLFCFRNVSAFQTFLLFTDAPRHEDPGAGSITEAETVAGVAAFLDVHFCLYLFLGKKTMFHFI